MFNVISNIFETRNSDHPVCLHNTLVYYVRVFRLGVLYYSIILKVNMYDFGIRQYIVVYYCQIDINIITYIIIYNPPIFSNTQTDNYNLYFTRADQGRISFEYLFTDCQQLREISELRKYLF